MRVIVVGAGISGLAAAVTLRRAGVEVLVLEAGDRPGGRIRSQLVNGCVMEAGANFLSSGYRVMPALARQVGLTPRPLPNESALLLDGVVHTVRPSRPWTMYTGGTLPWRSLPASAMGAARMARHARRRSTADVVDWVDLDGLPAAEWAADALGEQVKERMMRPIFNGLYFQDLTTSSAAAVAAVASFGTRGATQTFDGGLSALTNLLAGQVDVRYLQRVDTVEADADQAIVTVGGRRHRAAAAIVAVPGDAALRIVTEASELERDLMGTDYSTGLLVGIGLERHVPREVFGGAYGLIVHPAGGSPIAALAVAGRAGHGSSAGHDLVTMFYSGAAARARSARSDDHIIEDARQRLSMLAPDLAPLIRRDPACHRVARIRHAMPTCRPGRIGGVAAYRAACDGRRRILAGDYLAFPWTDSAAATGVWAAQHALAHAL